MSYIQQRSMAESKRLLYSTNQHLMKRFAKDYLAHCDEFLVHKINTLFVYNFTIWVEVVNEISLEIKTFETEKEALDFCLDNFTASKKTKQGSLF